MANGKIKAASDPASRAAEEDGREVGSNFIRDIIEADLAEGRCEQVVTRFPPEPNGYLHIGHAKSICLNFGLARDFGGTCHLRFDDTNPETEEAEYVQAIKDSVRWLGFDWHDKEFYASDYFEQLYRWAEQLIEDGKAYVDDLSEEEIRAYRGTVTEPGRESPHRNRSVEENLDLFRRMRAGAFGDGEKVLRARIDMASPNMKMRDPLMYRIKHAHHYRTGDEWCIYPMYDWAHGQSDAIEGITHSLCTLEFDNNRELYDWFLENLGIAPRPHQYEFARGNLDFTVMSKRKLLELVQDGHVSGWDDPRLPTLAGLRRRGVTPEAIRTFWSRVGVAKANSRVEVALLEHTLRDDLNHRAPRVMGVLRPLKVVLTNYPEDQEEWLEAPYWPHDIPKEGTRSVPFSRELLIERDDFMEDPPRKFYRLAPGREVRLRYGYFITCEEVVKDETTGEVVELRCTYDPATRGGDAPDGRRVKGTLHWVSARHALPAEVRLYDRLFTAADPDAEAEDYKAYLNPESLVTLSEVRVEPSIAEDPADTRYQFERQGYFWRDPADAGPDRLVFNRIVSLRDTWSKISQAARGVKQQAEKKSDEAKARLDQPQPRPKPAVSPKPSPQDPVEALSPEARERFLRYTRELDLQIDDALILADDAELAQFFEHALEAHGNAQGAANWIVNELLREVKDTPVAALPFTGSALGALVALIDEGTISSRIAKEVFEKMLETGEAPEVIVEKKGLEQVSDPAVLEPMIDGLVEAHPDKVEAYRGGKTGLIGFFVGQVMRETKGRANPELVQQVLRDRLEA